MDYSAEATESWLLELTEAEPSLRRAKRKRERAKRVKRLFDEWAVPRRAKFMAVSQGAAMNDPGFTKHVATKAVIAGFVGSGLGAIVLGVLLRFFIMKLVEWLWDRYVSDANYVPTELAPVSEQSIPDTGEGEE